MRRLGVLGTCESPSGGMGLGRASESIPWSRSDALTPVQLLNSSPSSQEQAEGEGAGKSLVKPNPSSSRGEANLVANNTVSLWMSEGC